MDRYSSPDFKPAPWCFNGHAHTILCSFLIKPVSPPYERVRIDTPDNDFLDVDLLRQSPSAPTVLLCHGLEGSSNRYYIRQLAAHLYHDGLNVVALNFRSCSGKLNRQPRFYHSGETKDISTVLDWINQEFESEIVFCAGFSLGASAMLNYIYKTENRAGINAFAAVSTPFDLKRGSLNLQSGFNKIYEINFLNTLRRKAAEKREQFPEIPTFSGKTLYDFDDQVTAPVHGFADADDYYGQCSSAFFMDKIKTYGLIIHSREDPLCPFEYTPVKAIEDNPNLTPVFPSKGGHVGFWSMPPGWLSLSIGRYFQSHLR